ncbi:hypothetical protein DFR76_109476 [Nocardia pseudobrasiliensis]|uniref:Uncharacterized protein n=1 Tax=Nocardia pseudobrasiliensis TaxID=45979 RepID=A0A370I474_9NOCA|nr:hypothetical protein DFR76_109476 [Nocardia pseudobrasiliensis]
MGLGLFDGCPECGRADEITAYIPRRGIARGGVEDRLLRCGGVLSLPFVADEPDHGIGHMVVARQRTQRRNELQQSAGGLGIARDG